MALTGEEIRHRLSVFAAKWSVYDGSEKAEAQTFCTEMFQCYGTAIRGSTAHVSHTRQNGVNTRYPRPDDPPRAVGGTRHGPPMRSRRAPTAATAASTRWSR